MLKSKSSSSLQTTDVAIGGRYDQLLKDLDHLPLNENFNSKDDNYNNKIDDNEVKTHHATGFSLNVDKVC